VKVANKRNDKLFLHRISRDVPSTTQRARPSSDVPDWVSIFPPRRQWHSFRPRDRRERASPDRDPKERLPRASSSLNLESLLRAVLTLRRRTPQAAWVEKLNQKVVAIQDRVLSQQAFTFQAPRVHPAPKDRKKHEYRPLAVFSPEDKIIEGLTARYLRDTLDPALRPSCLAFRCRRGQAPAPDIHYALEQILKMNRRHRKTGMFVAECDIKGFFDCVSHEVARTALDELVRDARRKAPKLRIHNRARQIFEAYLGVYSFSDNVLGSALPALQRRYSQLQFKWPAEELKHLHGTETLPRIGVPQGGALSNFIANAVLHSADKELDRLKRRLGRSFRYLRYCDDMVLLAYDREVCQAAFELYCRVLERLKLPIHPPSCVQAYSREFWGGKSNAPYHWRRPHSGNEVPWIQFVGYQVRYDGLLRLRPKSLKKQFKKMTTAADELLATLNPGRSRPGEITAFAPGISKNQREILHRFRMKLISMAVGRRELGQQLSEPMPMCWARGFKGLVGKKLISGALKALDRHRERQIRRVKRRLSQLPQPPDPGRKRRKRGGAHRYYGHPFSYWAQFQPPASR